MRRLAAPDGSSTTELVLVMPAVLLLVMLSVQFGLWLHARQVASSAAQEGVAVAQLPTGTVGAATDRASVFLEGVGGLLDPDVDVTRTGQIAQVAVTGDVPTVVPGMDLRVARQASGPVERFIAETER